VAGNRADWERGHLAENRRLSGLLEIQVLSFQRLLRGTDLAFRGRLGMGSVGSGWVYLLSRSCWRILREEKRRNHINATAEVTKHLSTLGPGFLRFPSQSSSFLARLRRSAALGLCASGRVPRLALVLAAFVLAQGTAQVQVVTGTHIGDGSNQAFAGVGFQFFGDPALRIP